MGEIVTSGVVDVVEGWLYAQLSNGWVWSSGFLNPWIVVNGESSSGGLGKEGRLRGLAFGGLGKRDDCSSCQ